MPTGGSARDEEAALLRQRAHMILEAFERAEPSPSWARFRELTDRARTLTDLRTINRELRGAMAALSSTDRRELVRTLDDRFGPDAGFERDRRAAERALARGRIRSEREYRAVQAYADSIAGDREAESQYLSLGALLDDFMASPSLDESSSPE